MIKSKKLPSGLIVKSHYPTHYTQPPMLDLEVLEDYPTLDYSMLNPTLAKELSYAEYDIAQLHVENLALKEAIVELRKQLDNKRV